MSEKPKKGAVRVRMYRHGLGDCFLLTFPRENGARMNGAGQKGGRYFNVLIDCGALGREAPQMKDLAEEIKREVGGGPGAPGLDLVVATHEHRDHLSGFDGGREVFEEIGIKQVWLSWLENLTDPEADALRKMRLNALEALHKFKERNAKLYKSTVRGVVGFAVDEEVKGMQSGKSKEPKAPKAPKALDFLKRCGKKPAKYLHPGEMLKFPEVPGVRVYVLGPPHDPALLKRSEVTRKMEKDEVVYHLAKEGTSSMAALTAALDQVRFKGKEGGAEPDSAVAAKYLPFAEEHRLLPEQVKKGYYEGAFKEYLDETYLKKDQGDRKIDDDWIEGFGQLALDLDNDTNNTSLVLAFEILATQQVLLFVGDAQVGSWRSWEHVTFDPPGSAAKVTGHDLLRRTVFYKVGHHCSHNATLKKGGLELMTSDRLVAYVPLDKATARNQGAHGGWKMPAEALFDALQKKTAKRVVLSDMSVKVPEKGKKRWAKAPAKKEVGKVQWVDFFSDW